MTLEQRNRVRLELRHYGKKHWANSANHQRWRDAIDETLRYYDETDPIRSELLRLRYIEKRTEEKTIEKLHIGRTTYQKAQDDLLSTVAIYAAQLGAF